MHTKRFLDHSSNLGVNMNKYCVLLAIIVFIASVQCQEYDTINTSKVDTESNLSISLISLDSKCNVTAQFCPGSKVTAARLETFRIDAENRGEEPIRFLNLTAILPLGAKYINSSYLEIGGGKLAEEVSSDFDETENTSIKWDLGDMQPNEIKSMLLRTYLRCSINETHVELIALGYNTDKLESVSADKPIFLKECNCTSELFFCTKKATSRNVSVGIKAYAAEKNTSAFFGRYSELANYYIYNITVVNGDIPLDEVFLFGELPHGMMLKNTAYSDPRRGLLFVDQDPIVFNEASNTTLTWTLGSMLAGEIRSIILEAYVKPFEDNENISVKVDGYSLEWQSSFSNSSESKAESACNPICPNWEIII